jgi:hypothetical protein
VRTLKPAVSARQFDRQPIFALRFDHKSSEAIDLGRNIKGRYSCATPEKSGARDSIYRTTAGWG